MPRHTPENARVPQATAERTGPPWRPLLGATLLGVALRVLLVFAVGHPELQSDEANYAYLGLAHQHFGVLLDAHRYLWPPAYPWIVGEALGRFGVDGIRVLHLLQALASGAIGLSVGLLAWRLGSRRAALVATLLWAAYLPLAGFTHLLFAETLFLVCFVPALERLVAALQVTGARRDRAFLAAGLFFGAALWFKGLPLYLVGVLFLAAVVHLVRASGSTIPGALRSASLLPLAALVVTLPWGLRNLEVYGRFVPSGSTLGENAYIGANARYMNFDYVPLRRTRALAGQAPVEDRSRSFWVRPPQVDGRSASGWPRAEEMVHSVDRQDAQLQRSFAYAGEHPGWALRTRVKRLADLATPLSFFTRHSALGLYSDSWIGGRLARTLLVGLALAQAAGLLVLGALGLGRGLRSSAGWAVLAPPLVYVAASSMLLSMSRLRSPAEPLLLVLAALFLVHGLESSKNPARARVGWGAGAALLFALAALWWINAPEVLSAARDALNGGPSARPSS